MIMKNKRRMKVMQEKNHFNDKKIMNGKPLLIGEDVLTLIIKDFKKQIEQFKSELKEIRSTVTLLWREYPPKRSILKSNKKEQNNEKSQ